MIATIFFFRTVQDQQSNNSLAQNATRDLVGMAWRIAVGCCKIRRKDSGGGDIGEVELEAMGWNRAVVKEVQVVL